MAKKNRNDYNDYGSSWSQDRRKNPGKNVKNPRKISGFLRMVYIIWKSGSRKIYQIVIIAVTRAPILPRKAVKMIRPVDGARMG